jgi:hypothetical protein
MSYKRICPICKNIINHKNNKRINKKEGRPCTKCSGKIKIEAFNNKIKEGKIKHPMLGKKHKDVTIEKIKKTLSNRELPESWYKKQKQNCLRGKKHPFKNKKLFDVWVNKYGYELARKKWDEWILKMSDGRRKGKNSYRFGKTPSKGAGNGISGWYKGVFFRSLYELSYYIYVIERFNLKFESGELNKYKITYNDLDNNIKTYKPDFVINNKYIVEIKPKNLINIETNKLKFYNAKKWCDENNYIFKITNTIHIIKKNDLLNLIKEGNLKLTKKWEERII